MRWDLAPAKHARLDICSLGNAEPQMEILPHFGEPRILVLGHTQCGALAGAVHTHLSQKDSMF